MNCCTLQTMMTTDEALQHIMDVTGCSQVGAEMAMTDQIDYRAWDGARGEVARRMADGEYPDSWTAVLDILPGPIVRQAANDAAALAESRARKVAHRARA